MERGRDKEAGTAEQSINHTAARVMTISRRYRLYDCLSSPPVLYLLFHPFPPCQRMALSVLPLTFFVSCESRHVQKE